MFLMKMLLKIYWDLNIKNKIYKLLKHLKRLKRVLANNNEG